VTATHTDATGTPVVGADIVFTAERSDGTLVDTATVATDGAGQAAFTYTYGWPSLPEVGTPQVDAIRAELASDAFVDAHTTVTWSAGVATNTTTGDTFHDLNDAVVAAEAGHIITAEGAFTSVYGTPRDDRIEVNKSLTLQGNGTTSLVGAFDVRASNIVLDGFDISRGGNKEYAVRIEGAGIAITNNVIDATGMNAINVRDAWSPVPGGGSATIAGNTISDAAIGIHVDVDKHEGRRARAVRARRRPHGHRQHHHRHRHRPSTTRPTPGRPRTSAEQLPGGCRLERVRRGRHLPEDAVALDLGAILAATPTTRWARSSARRSCRSIRLTSRRWCGSWSTAPARGTCTPSSSTPVASPATPTGRRSVPSSPGSG
jgi:hypothetical protein